MRSGRVITLVSSILVVVAAVARQTVPIGAQTAPPCQVGSIAASAFWQGATGSLVGGVVVQNIGDQPCGVRGAPAIWLADGQEQPLPVLQASARANDVSATPVVLRPGDEAWATLFWNNWCYAPPVDGVYILLTLQHETVAVGGWDGKPLAGAPRCDNPPVAGDPTSGRSLFDVGVFAPYPPSGP